MHWENKNISSYEVMELLNYSIKIKLEYVLQNLTIPYDKININFGMLAIFKLVFSPI